ncbi:MAG TPA: carboxypeptidase regulatory-like domain-containing protein [Candidatus Acidoferrales bacterium]
MKTKYFVALALLVAVSSGLVILAAPPAGNGSITGKVTYTGTPPKMKPIDMSKEPTCAKQHATPVMTENVVTGSGNVLGDVVVYISAGAPETSAPSQIVRYDQKGCQYLPHVLAMQASQPLEIYNDDQTSHNIHPLAKVNQEWNKSQPPGTPPIQAKYEKPEFIPVKCNIHPWMHGYFAVLNTSHYSITGEDGSFNIKDLPAGKYTVTAWQEQYGTQNQEVTVGAGESKSITFSFKVLPY